MVKYFLIKGLGTIGNAKQINSANVYRLAP